MWLLLCSCGSLREACGEFSASPCSARSLTLASQCSHDIPACVVLQVSILCNAHDAKGEDRPVNPVMCISSHLSKKPLR